MTTTNDLFEKSFTPKIKYVHESEYTNAKGETKKQCFINVNPYGVALILPYDKEVVCEKYRNERYPDNLNIPIKKDHMFHVAIRKEGKNEYKDISGTELRQEIDYYININLKDTYMNPCANNPGRVQIMKNSLSFIIPENWIKEGPYGQYLRVKHNAKIDVSVAKTGQTAEERQYESKRVTWNYVHAAFDKSPRLSERISDKSQKDENNTPGLEKAAKEMAVRE